MHALHLPRRHFLGVTFVAALLTLTVMAVLLLPAGRLAPGDGSSPAATGGAGATGAAPATTTRVRPPFIERPTWMTDPLAAPVLGAGR